MELRKYKSAAFIAHFAFWSVATIFSFYRGLSISDSFIMPLLHLLVNMMAFYAIYLLFIPRYLEENRIGLFIGSIMVVALVAWILRISLNWGFVQFEPDKAFILSQAKLGQLLLNILFTLLIISPFHLADVWYKKVKLREELDRRKVEAELQFLKAQINPHFLFNVLNNAYSLTLMESDKAGPSIQKLTSLMDFMLNECTTDVISLSREIDYLRDYLDLQQLKKDGEMNIEFEVDGKMDHIQIPPLLLIPLYENAFKHGNLEDVKNGWLKSQIRVEENGFEVYLKNSIGYPKKGDLGGIGLENIQQRLELIYPNQHGFSVKKLEDEFHVHVKINDVHRQNPDSYET